MKKLILLRHGKAADHWEDFARPLSTKGKEEVRGVATKLLSFTKWCPQGVICSEAERAKQTFEIFTSVFSRVSLKTKFVERLYHGNLEDLRNMISETEDAIQTLLIVGHNPVLSEFASLCSDESVPLGTANAAVLSAKDESLTWKGLQLHAWALETVLKPD